MAGSQMFVDMKMSITTYGAHSGLIVHSGIHQGKSNPPLIWPYSNDTQPTSPPSIPFTSTQEPVAVPQQQQQPQQSLPWRKEPSPQTSPVYSFHGTDSPPSEFIEPGNVQLNVFRVDSPEHTESQSRKELKDEQAVGHHPDALLNDARTTTTTVEIFRTKVDPNNPDEYLTLPPVPAPGMDGRPQVLRAMGPDYEKWTNTRTETLLNEPVKWRDNVGSRSLSEAVPHDENYASTAIVNSTYHPAQLASAYQPAANRRMQRRNESVSQQRARSRRHQEFPYYGDRTGHSDADKEEKGENIYEVARSRSVEEMSRLYEPDYTRQRTRMRNGESFYVASAGNPPRRLEATRTGMANTEPRSATSEEIFHLYETRDAFGNIRAQCEPAIELRHQSMPSSAQFALASDSNVPHNSGTANRRNKDELNDRIITTAAQPSDDIEYVLSDEPTHITHYSIKNAVRSSFPSSEHPIRRGISEAFRTRSPPCDFNSQRKSGKFSPNFEAWNTCAVHETETSSASFQPIFESEKTASLSRFAEKRVNSPNTAVPFESENCNSIAVNDERLRRSESVLNDDDSIYLCSKHGDESRSEMFALEGDLWERHSPDILSQFSTLELQPILEERKPVSPESLRSGDSRRKQRDVPLLACKLPQAECEGEYTEPKCTVCEKTISKPESDNFLSDNVNGASEHSLPQESDHVKSSTSLIDRATSPQNHGSDSLIKLDKDESSIFHSSPYPILNVSSSATINTGPQIPLVNAEADSKIGLNQAGNPNYGAIHSRSPLFTDNADFDNESKNVAIRKSETLFLECPSTNIRNNGKPEFEACMRVAETKLVGGGKDKLVMKESVPTASIDDGFEADDEPTTSVTPTDLSAAPSKSILHVHNKPTRLGKHKSVSFPSREPEVVVSEHRLIITGVESDSDTV